LDLKDADAQATARAIALQCDVVVENFRPGVASRLGLGPELRETKPSLIYASISGFGQTGPDAHLPAYDLVAQAMSGLMAATGDVGGKPLKVGESYGDLMAGLYASWAILAALHRRNATGEGSTIDVAMFDALFSLLPTSHALQFYAGRTPTPVGNRHPLSTPFGCFACADGQAVIAVLGDRQWQALCGVIGSDMGQDAALATDEGRTLQEPRIKAAIEEWTLPRPMADVVTALSAAGIPTAQVQSLAQAAASPHAQARELVSQMAHPVFGHSAIVGQPVRFDGAKPISATSAPQLGADGPAILAKFGIAP
jgi:CoA:oxalate CoA-transferase